MQAYVLLGSEEAQKKHITSFIQEHKIPPYLVTKFDPLKIAEVRILQKTFSLRLKEEEKRLIVVSNATIEAQNALLKTIEELSNQNFVFFLSASREDLVSTILSRSFTIQLENLIPRLNERMEKTIKNSFMNEKKDELFELFNSLNSTIELQDIESVLLSARNVLLKSFSQDRILSSSLLQFIKQLDANYKLAKTNNINKKNGIRKCTF